jgi:hypothetical protein
MRPALVAAVAGLAVLAGCTDEQANFKSEGEDFINDDERVATAVGGDVDGTECEEPADTEVGTIYTCTATTAGGEQFEFTVEITGDRELTVQDFQPLDG